MFACMVMWCSEFIRLGWTDVLGFKLTVCGVLWVLLLLVWGLPLDLHFSCALSLCLFVVGVCCFAHL